MKVQVHHHDAEIGKLVHVANVEYDGELHNALDYAWEHTQNLWGSWSRPEFIGGRSNGDYCENVEVIAPLPVHDGKVFGLRSSMVGDVFAVEGHGAFKVASFGFEPVEVPA